MKQKGFTLVELIIIVAIIAIFLLVGAIAFVNNRAATERRATANAELFIEKNGIAMKRMTCAGDSDGDGYGSCVVVTAAEEKINLECPTNFFDVKVLKATGCKEVIRTLNIQ